MTCRWFLSILLATAYSCSSPIHRSEIPLRDSNFQSADGILRGKIPVGWFVPAESDLSPHLAAWLIRDDYSAVLTFEEITIDQKTGRLIERGGMRILAELSFELKKAREPSATLLNRPRELSLGGSAAAQYEYRSDDGEDRTSVVVFRAKDRYFESTIVATAPHGQSNHAELVATQQAVIASIGQ